MFAGYGDNSPCDGCDLVILPNQIEYEFEGPDGSRTFHFHIGCVGLWEAERRRRGWVRSDIFRRSDPQG
jgi:hypothetical protein